MNMTMKDGLSRNLTTVHSDVEAFYRAVGLKQALPLLLKEKIDCGHLGRNKIEVLRGVTLGNDERVPLTHWKSIANCKCE